MTATDALLSLVRRYALTDEARDIVDTLDVDRVRWYQSATLDDLVALLDADEAIIVRTIGDAIDNQPIGNAATILWEAGR